MKLKSILNEQSQVNKKYNHTIDDVTCKFWGSLVEMYGKPLSESAFQKNTKSLETLLFQTAMFLPDTQRKRFFESLLNPTDAQLNEGIKDFVKNTVKKSVDLVVKTQDKIDNAKTTIFKKIYSIGKGVFDKYVPESVKKMGKDIIKKVINGIGVMVDKAADFLKKIAEKLKTLGKSDPCVGVNESFGTSCHGLLLNENTQTPFTPELLKHIVRHKDVDSSNKIENKVAWVIAILKQENVEVYGRDLRAILRVISKEYGYEKELDLANDENSKISEWYQNNRIEERVKKAENALKIGGASGIGAWCSIEPDLIEEHFGPKSAAGQGFKNLGLDKDSVVSGIIRELKNSKGSLFITMASLLISISSGVGALRIAGLVFASAIPLIIDARITNLKNKGAPDEQIDFWNKAKSISKFIANVVNLFNIGALISSGWAAAADTNTDALAAANSEEIIDNYDSLDGGSSFNFSDDVQKQWDSLISRNAFNEKTMYAYVDYASTNMNDEQFANLQQLVLDTGNKSDPQLAQEAYAKLVYAMDHNILDVNDINTEDAIDDLQMSNTKISDEYGSSSSGSMNSNDIPNEDIPDDLSDAVPVKKDIAALLDEIDETQHLKPENKQIFDTLISENADKLNSKIIGRLTDLVTDTSYAKALDSLDSTSLKIYLETIVNAKEQGWIPISPTTISLFNIKGDDIINVTNTIKELRDSGIVGRSAEMIKAMKDLDIDITQPLSEEDVELLKKQMKTNNLD